MRGNSSSSSSGSGSGSRSRADGRATAPTDNGRQAGVEALQSSSTVKTDSSIKLVFGLSSKTNKLKHDEYAEKRGATIQLLSRATLQDSATSKIMSDNGAPVEEGRIRANRIASTKPLERAPSRNANCIDRQQDELGKVAPLSKREPIVPSTSAAKSAPIETETRKHRSSSPGSGKGSQQRTQSPDKPVETTSGKRRVGVTVSPNSTKQTAINTNKPAEQNNSSSSTTNKIATTNEKQDLPPNQEETDKPKRMQFNIPPPPQVSSSSSRKGSVVSYAKSRIYDKPAKQHLSNPPTNTFHLLDKSNLPVGHMLSDSYAAIPESILSGFKPPKQVNVSKAREKWEGGEPFAKCKSRQRLAAQKAGKKLQLHGTWSMTSVVATQQLQLQQALANSSSPVRSNLDKSDPSVKILTRGSVLERVQQFEKAPESAIGGLLSDSESDTELDESSKETVIAVAGSKSTSTSGTDAPVTTSKQALYKTRVSSIQSASTGSNSVGSLQQSTDLLLASISNSNNTNRARQLATSGAATRRLSLRRRSSATDSSSIIPKFYHPNGRPNTYEIELQKKNIVACFDKLPDKRAILSVPAYKRHFSSIAIACGLSEYFKEPLFLYIKHQLTQSNLLHNTHNGAPLARKQSGLVALTNGNGTPNLAATGNLASRRQSVGETKPTLMRSATIDNPTMEKIQNQTYITCEQFLICWRHLISTCFDNPARFVHMLTFGERKYLLPDDFVPLVQSVIEDHPGLKFLRAAPDFHMRYIQTVIARIYFCINKSWTGKISLSELRQSNLLAVLQVLGQEEDINQITDYFSYEHFYVIYCRFWSLDQDHDLLISKEDLAKHNDAAISSRVIERIFMGIVSRHIQQTGKMSYSDFVWFLIAEEDKKHPRSIEYWFRLMDIDGDGYISMYEMEYFYYEQMKRLELMNIEALPFVDSACQILDLVNPKEKNKISLSDLKRSKMATIFFDTFINLEKYLEHESREFVSTRDCVQGGVVISDWDRYASEEYESLVAEESSV